MLETEQFAGLSPLPFSASPGDAVGDCSIAPLAWLGQHMSLGYQGALVTIVGIDGGAPRPVGTQMAVLSDGRYFGQLSGGCVEPAIAAEAQAVISGGVDAMVRFGKGAKAIDIRFPCGGGVDVLIHFIRDVGFLEEALRLSRQRQPFNLVQTIGGFTEVSPDLDLVGLHGDRFFWPFLPRTRALLIGRGEELEAVARLADVSGYEVRIGSPSEDSIATLAPFCSEARYLSTPDTAWDLPIDAWTATVLLFHEHDWEQSVLMRALASDGFYIGALGSPKTHRNRVAGLLARGADAVALERIKGPLGLIPQARDPRTLAISILAEVAAERAAAFG